MTTRPIPSALLQISVNRVKIVDLPGLAIDPEVQGQTAYQLLSNLAVIRYARQNANALNLPAAYLQDTKQTRLELPRFVNDALDSPNLNVRQTAQHIARQLGRNLGHVLVTLHRGDAVNQAARPDWEPENWAYWHTIKQVWLGGGLLSAHLGTQIIHYAQSFLQETGYQNDIQVALSPHQKAMTLLGAARYLPAGTYNALCFDFGQTSVKRACVRIENGRIIHLQEYPALAVEWDVHHIISNKNQPDAQQVLAFVIDVIAQTLSSYKKQPYPYPKTELAPHLMLCMAAYIRGGQLLGNGLYPLLKTLAADTRLLLAQTIETHLGWRTQVDLIHDGTAACTLHAGESNTAVLTIGTAIGIGFPPADQQGLRLIARHP